MFPGIFAVENHRAQRVVALRTSDDLLDLANHIIGRALRVIARGGEPNEITQRPLTEREARAGIAELRAVPLEQHGAVEDPARMHHRQAPPEILLIGGEPLIPEFFEARDARTAAANPGLAYSDAPTRCCTPAA